MKNKLLLAAALLISSVSISLAQQTGSFTKPITFSSVVYPNQARNMAYYVPASYTPTKKYKLFISLGGQGWTIANDLISPYGPSSPGTVDLLTNSTYAATYGDFIVVSPSISPQAYQAGAPDGTWPYPDDADDGLPEAIINIVKATYNIDTNYVYLTGFSLGARGALYLGLNSYKKLRGLILFTPAVQGLNEAKNLDYYQTASNPYCYYSYNNAKNIPICMTVGASDPNKAGCSFCTPVETATSYASVIIPQVDNQLIAAGASATTKFNTVTGLAHARPSASYMCNCFNFIEGLHTTGIAQEEKQIENAMFFPNPSGGTFFLTNTDLSKYENVAITVKDVLGQTVQKLNFVRPTTKDFMLDLRNNISGVYFVEIAAGNYTHTTKLILEK